MISFCITTTSLGWLTAKYGSAVMIMPNDCSDVVTLMSFFLSEGSTSPSRLGLPSGVIAHSTYVRYSGPKPFAGGRPEKRASIVMRPRSLCTFASPLAPGSSVVPRKFTFVDPLRWK